MSSGQTQQFCVRWNSHLGSIGAAFPQVSTTQLCILLALSSQKVKQNHHGSTSSSVEGILFYTPPYQ